MTERHVPPFELDALAAAALPEPAATAARAHLVSCPACRAVEQARAVERRRFRDEILPRTLPVLRARCDRRKDRRWWWPVLTVPVTAAIVMGIGLSQDRPAGSDDLSDEIVREKGGPALEILVRRGDDTLVVQDRTVCAPDDELRFVVDAGGAPYVMVVSLDGRGSPNVYYPFEGQTSAAVASGRTALPGTIVLDDVVGPERFFALFSDRPLTRDRVLVALRDVAERGVEVVSRLPLEGVSQVSVLIEKRRPR